MKKILFLFFIIYFSNQVLNAEIKPIIEGNIDAKIKIISF